MNDSDEKTERTVTSNSIVSNKPQIEHPTASNQLMSAMANKFNQVKEKPPLAIKTQIRQPNSPAKSAKKQKEEVEDPLDPDTAFQWYKSEKVNRSEIKGI